MKKYNKSTSIITTSIAILALLGTIWLIFSVKSPRKEVKKSRRYFTKALLVDGKTAFYFRAIGRDTTFIGTSLKSQDKGLPSFFKLNDRQIKRALKSTNTEITHKLASIDSILFEINYYLSIRRSNEENYEQVLAYCKEVEKRQKELKELQRIINNIKTDSKLEIKTIKFCSPHPDIPFIDSGNGVWRLMRCKKPRHHGRGIMQDRWNRWIFGVWEKDSLLEGRRYDNTGMYVGAFDKDMTASDFGIQKFKNGGFYKGQWLCDNPHNTGIAVTSDGVKAGKWHYGKHLGEQMEHSNERIYGIDISRFQHGLGKKYIPIDWSSIKITDLGGKHKGILDNEEALPISFVYVKSTEGITIKNVYYKNDCSQVRAHGLRCGAYHFFSTTSSASEQAQFFLNNTVFYNGDMPPVLDLEPSTRKINMMGGKEAMLDSVRVWVNLVEKAIGIKPIIYVSQHFLKKYFKEAPDIRDNYSFWIARYSEYRPDVHATIWQLSPSGRVKGIKGEVDINVFNGYCEHYKCFIDTALVQHDICIETLKCERCDTIIHK